MSFPNLMSEDLSLVEWSHRLKLFISNMSALEVSRVLFVEIGGSDVTGMRGRADKPFLTLQAALNAALTGDMILIGPGTFLGNAAQIPDDLLAIEICGAGPLVTTLVQSVAGTPGLYRNTGTAMQSLIISNLSMWSNSAATAPFFYYDGTASHGASFAFGRLAFDNVLMIGTNGAQAVAQIDSINSFRADRLWIPTNDILSLDRVGGGYIADSTLYTLSNVNAGGADQPTGGVSEVRVTSTRIQSLISTGGAGTYCDAGTYVVGNVVATHGEMTPQGHFTFHGVVQGNLTVQFNCISTVGFGVFNLDGCEVVGNLVAERVAGGGAFRMTSVSARCSVLHGVHHNDVYAGDYCDLDIRGASFNQQALGAGVTGGALGTIDRDTHYIPTPDPAYASGATVPLTFLIPNPGGGVVNFPAGATYGVVAESQTVGGVPAVTTKTPTGFSIVVPALGGTIPIDLTVVRAG